MVSAGLVGVGDGRGLSVRAEAMGAKCCKALLDREQEVDFSLTLLNFVLYVHSTPHPHIPQTPTKGAHRYGYRTPDD